MSVFKRVSKLAALLAIVNVTVTATAATYTVTDLKAQFPNAFGEFAINNVGHIMGHAVDPQLPAPNKYTFIYANGTINRLASPARSYPESLGFNDNDEMTGNLYEYAADGVTISSRKIFLYRNGQLTDITSVLPKAQNPTNIQTINNAGVLLGNYSYHSDTVYLYDSNTGQQKSAMNTYGGVRATALNNVGQITGQNFFSGLNHAFLYSGNFGGTEIHSFAPQRDRNDYSYGLGINDAGLVVGYAGTPSGYSHAFLYQNGALTDLGTLNGFSSSASDINNSGIIVGGSQISSTGGDDHAFIYAANAMTDLNSLVDPNDPLAAGITLVSATAINDRGEILVKGRYASGLNTTFLLTPKQTSTDTAHYHFEQTTHDWYNSGEDIVTVSSSTAKQFAGASSLAVQFNGAGYVAVGAMYPPLLAGKTVTFHVYIPADAAVDWIQPFALEDYQGNWTWHGNWQPISNLQLGAWNTITLAIPADATPFYRIGVEFSASRPYTGTVYIDSVSF